NPLPFPTWNYAFNTAADYVRLMKLAQTTINDYWEFMNDFPLLSTGPTTLYPSYYAAQTLMQNFPPGAVMFSTSTTTTSVLTMGADDPATGRIAIVVLNTGMSTTQTVTINGLPAGFTMQQTRSSSTENSANVGLLTTSAGGSFSFSLAPQTMSTLWGFS